MLQMTSEQFNNLYPNATTVSINAHLTICIATGKAIQGICTRLKVDPGFVQSKMFYLQLAQKGSWCVIYEDLELLSNYYSDDYDRPSGLCDWTDTKGDLLQLGFIPDEGQTPVQFIEYQIGSHYLSALINADYSGLEDREESKLNEWLESEFNDTDRGHWSHDCYCESYYGRCDVSGLMSSVVDILWIKR